MAARRRPKRHDAEAPRAPTTSPTPRSRRAVRRQHGPRRWRRTPRSARPCFPTQTVTQPLRCSTRPSLPAKPPTSRTCGNNTPFPRSTVSSCSMVWSSNVAHQLSTNYGSPPLPHRSPPREGASPRHRGGELRGEAGAFGTGRSRLTRHGANRDRTGDLLLAKRYGGSGESPDSLVFTGDRVSR